VASTSFMLWHMLITAMSRLTGPAASGQLHRNISFKKTPKTQLYNACGFEAPLMSYLGQFHREVLVDEKARRRAVIIARVRRG
jgi:hypothetical protein